MALISTLSLAACSGGGDTPPAPPDPESPDIITGATQNLWLIYRSDEEDRENDYIRIYSEQKERTGFVLFIDNVYYFGKFTWESSDGDTIKATQLIFDESTPNEKSLPTTATIYSFKTKIASYIEYDDSTWEFSSRENNVNK